MRKSTPSATSVSNHSFWVQVPYYGLWALLIYMPFHIFASQSLSLLTGGLDVWKIAKDILLVGLVLFTICSVTKERRGTGTFWAVVAITVAYGCLHGLLWLTHQQLDQSAAALGTLYNLRLPAFLILGYGAVLLRPQRFVFATVLKMVLAVSTVVAALGVVQYFLPSDILTHVGYSLERGARPAFFIDNHPTLPRVMSTLREPNALGAYLILPIAALTYLWSRVLNRDKRLVVVGSLGLHGLALFLTQSRSAWLGTAVAVAVVVWWQYGRQLLPQLRRWWLVAVVGLIVAGGVLWTQRQSSFFQEYIIHSNPQETVQDLDSNDYHWLLIRQGLEGIVAQPWGHGPGTAGIVSIRAASGGQLTENYYVQIGYEVGVYGMAAFIAGNIWLYLRLQRRGDGWAIVLCAAFWGYVVTNMLLHTWSNEAVAAQWWLLAGLALAPAVVVGTSPKKPRFKA